MHLSVAVVPAPALVVVRLTGDAGLPTLARLASALTRAAGHGTGSVVVDVAGARFADGSALQALAGFSDTLAAGGRRCRVVGAPAAVRRQVAESGLAGRLELDGPLTGQDPVRPRPRPDREPPWSPGRDDAVPLDAVPVDAVPVDAVPLDVAPLGPADTVPVDVLRPRPVPVAPGRRR